MSSILFIVLFDGSCAGSRPYYLCSNVKTLTPLAMRIVGEREMRNILQRMHLHFGSACRANLQCAYIVLKTVCGILKVCVFKTTMITIMQARFVH